MITTIYIAPLAGTVGGGFFIGFIAGYAIKKVIKLTAVRTGVAHLLVNNALDMRNMTHGYYTN
jgi:uncharacterized membrane protein (Fun14 family)